MALHLQRVQRLDSISLDSTYFTKEGYLIDHPIVTSTGIFEYKNPDGSVRRELRLPEEVFSEASLQSYKGKPIIITHDAGYVDKDNVDSENIGTILSNGYKDGDNVRAEIIIHDTNAMENCGLRELSLGYNLELDETPGEWDGKPYDAIQRKITVNHLALVGEARAGEKARLNIDSRDVVTLKGERVMEPKDDKNVPEMTPDEIEAAINAFHKRRDERMAPPKTDEDDPEETPATENEPEEPQGDSDDVDPVQAVRDRRDRRDAEGDPEDMKGAMGIIARQDEDIDSLLGTIDAMRAGKKHCDEDEPEEPEDEPEEDEDDSEPEEPQEDEGGEEPADDKRPFGKKNADRKDSKDDFRELLKVVRIGDRLNMDGLESLSVKDAKKAVINKLEPSLRLDGKSTAYINAAFDMTVAKMGSRKDANYQRRQMMNRDGQDTPKSVGSAAEARMKMIQRRMNKEDK